MSWYLLVEAGLILLLCALTRFLFLHGSTSDTWVELWLIRKFVDGDGDVTRPSDSVVDGIYGRPFLLNWFLSRFPERYWQVLGTAVNIGADLCLVIVVYALTFVLHGQPLVTGPFSFAGWTALLTGLTPLYHPINSRLRGCFKTRSTGTWLAFLSVACMWLAVELHVLWSFPSMLLFVLTLLTSQFGTQIVVFFLVIMSFWTGSLLPVGVLAGTCLVLWWCSDWFRVFVRWKLGHFSWYFFQQRNVSPTERKNRLRDLFALPLRLFRDPVLAYRDIAQTHTITALLYLFPAGAVLLVVLGMVLVQGGFPDAIGNTGPLQAFSWYMAGAAGIAFVITSVYPFLFLGEAERYVEPSVPFVTFLFMVGVQRGHVAEPFLSIVLLWGLVVVLLNFIFIGSDGFEQTLLPEDPDALLELVQFLNGKEGNVLTIPLKYSCKISSHLPEDGLKFLIRGIQHPEGGKQWHEDIRHEEHHSYPHERLQEIVDRFEIDYLIVNRTELRERSFSYSFSAFSNVFQNNEFAVYRVKDT